MVLPMRVLVADDHALFRDFLATSLRGAGAEIVARAADGRQAVEMAWRSKPDVAVIDLRMPGMDGVEATRRLAAELPCIKVVLLAVSDDDPDVCEGICAGAGGCLLKSLAAERFAPAVAAVAAGEAVLTPALARQILKAFAEVTWRDDHEIYSLNDGERRVLESMTRGLTGHEELAAHTGIQAAAVGRVLRTILDKLQLQYRARLVAAGSTVGRLDLSRVVGR